MRSRRAAEWTPIAIVLAVAAAAGLLADGAIKESVFVLLLGALPGVAAYIAFRTWLASAVVSLVPLYFGVGAMILGSRTIPLSGGGFAASCLRLQYALDQPYNCFPSLHVAHSLVSALTCARVNRRVGVAAIAVAASFVFLRGYSRTVAPADRDRAPARAVRVAVIYTAVVGFFWILYLTGWTPR